MPKTALKTRSTTPTHQPQKHPYWCGIAHRDPDGHCDTHHSGTVTHPARAGDWAPDPKGGINAPAITSALEQADDRAPIIRFNASDADSQVDLGLTLDDAEDWALRVLVLVGMGRGK